jgi:hypothetical protein
MMKMVNNGMITITIKKIYQTAYSNKILIVIFWMTKIKKVQVKKKPWLFLLVTMKIYLI